MRLTGLWSQRAFAWLWTGQAVSQLGSQVTLVALPLTAILALDATPVQLGLLMTAGYAPAAVLGLFVGVWVDRVRRRRLLIACQLVLTATTLSVPVASWLGLLRLEHLFALQAINGALMVVVNAASQAYLPAIVGRAQLTEANAKLSTSTATTRIVGPGFAGVLIQLANAPTAILVDAVSFAASAVCLALVNVAEPPPSASVRRPFRAELHEGLDLVLGHRLIRPLVLSGAVYNFFAAIFTAIYSLFMVRDLGLPPASIGAIVACGGVGGVLGSIIAEPVARRLSSGRAIVGGMLLLAVMHLVAPVAFGSAMVTVPLLAGAGLFAQLGVAVVVVNRTSLIQQIVPAQAQGRVAATQQVVTLAAVPFGAALGGWIAESVGLRATVALAACGTIAATAVLLRSALWTTAAADSLEPLADRGGTTSAPPLSPTDEPPRRDPARQPPPPHHPGDVSSCGAAPGFSQAPRSAAARGPRQNARPVTTNPIAGRPLRGRTPNAVPQKGQPARLG